MDTVTKDWRDLFLVGKKDRTINCYFVCILLFYSCSCKYYRTKITAVSGLLKPSIFVSILLTDQEVTWIIGGEKTLLYCRYYNFHSLVQDPRRVWRVTNIVLTGSRTQAVSSPCAGLFRHAKEGRERGRKPATKEGRLSQDYHSVYQPKQWEAVATPGFFPVSCAPTCSVGPES